MLLRFGFENLHSFRDRTELSFVATALQDDPPYLLSAPGTAHGVAPAMALFGANASGKSNIVNTMGFFWTELRDSFKRDPSAPIPRSPFLLRREARLQPSRLDCDVLVDGVRLHYGFEVDDASVTEEWLYAWFTHRRTVLFHRQGSDRAGWYFGHSLGGRNAQIADFTRDNTLFFSVAAQHNHPLLRGLHTKLTAAVVIGDASPAQALRFLNADDPVLQEAGRDEVKRFLREADLGITDLRLISPDEKMSTLYDQMATVLGIPEEERDKNRVLARIQHQMAVDRRKTYVLELGHQAEHGVEFLAEESESLGTRTLLKLLKPVLSALASGTCLVLDELGSGLHPRLSAALLELFTSERSNPNGAQLLFTTHDDQLMDLLRRDEIGLVEKDALGCSTLRSLSDYEIRQRDNWRKGYEAGRFGAVPIIGDVGGVLAKPPPER